MSYSQLKLDHQLCFPLYAVSRLVVKHYKPFLDPLELTYTQYIVLLALWEHGSLTVSTLGDILYLDSGTLTPLLKKMALQGLVVRNRRPEDERSVAIELTEKGLTLKDKAAGIPSHIASCLPISREEGQILHRILFDILAREKEFTC